MKLDNFSTDYKINFLLHTGVKVVQFGNSKNSLKFTNIDSHIYVAGKHNDACNYVHSCMLIKIVT